MTLDPDEFGGHGPVIRDKRRIDPETGELREPQAAAAPGSPGQQPAGGSGPEAPAGSPQGRSDVEAALAERTADLQRLQAEYLNYKRRVERERENARTAGVANTLTSLLPVLDDIGRARDHGELTGGFKAVAESFERTIEKLGLVAFGEAGEPFDPRIHEALMHSYSDEVDGPVCQAVLQVGYQLGDKVLRPARVAVAEPPRDAVAEPPHDAVAEPPRDAVVVEQPEEGGTAAAEDVGGEGAAESPDAEESTYDQPTDTDSENGND